MPFMPIIYNFKFKQTTAQDAKIHIPSGVQFIWMVSNMNYRLEQWDCKLSGTYGNVSRNQILMTLRKTVLGAVSSGWIRSIHSNGWIPLISGQSQKEHSHSNALYANYIHFQV